MIFLTIYSAALLKLMREYYYCVMNSLKNDFFTICKQND